MNEYTAKEAIGKNFSILYPLEGKMLKEHIHNLETAKIEGRYRGEGKRQKKNGKIFVADVYIVPLTKKGEVTGYVKIVQDLTERNALIQEKNLSVSESMGLKVNQQLRESFVSTLAHDLRSPLTAAKISAQLILRNPHDDEKHLNLSKKIVDNITRTDKMISNLLDANRITAHEKIQLELKECNLTKIAEAVRDELSIVYGERIEINSDHDILGYWDDECITRILENLTTNALKYGDPGSMVTITLKEVLERVFIQVHNFGKVIKIEDQKRLFEPYQRLEDESSSKGWGLGLTLVKGLTEAHHGLVHVQSYPILGTTFTVELPISSADH